MVVGSAVLNFRPKVVAGGSPKEYRCIRGYLGFLRVGQNAKKKAAFSGDVAKKGETFCTCRSKMLGERSIME